MEENKKASDKTEENDVRKCKDCKKNFHNLSDYVDHLESKEHRKQLMKNRYGKEYLKAKAELEEKNGKTRSSTDSSDSGEFSDNQCYTCKACKKVCTGRVNYELHLNGKKHAKMIKKNFTEESDREDMKEKLHEKTEPKDDDNILESLLSPTKYASSSITCKPCNKTFSGPENYQQHLKCNAHKKKLSMQDVINDMESFAVTESASNTKYYECDICDKKLTNAEQYKIHLQGSVHFRKKREAERLSQLSQAVYKSIDESKLECELCHRAFSRSMLLKEHLESISHKKMEKKIKQLKELKQNHPEFQICNNALTGDLEYILCDVCRLPFSGPEAAIEHAFCPKHKRAASYANTKREKKASSTIENGESSTKQKHPSLDDSDLKGFEMVSMENLLS